VLEFAETDMSITEHSQRFDLAAQLAGLLKLIQTLVHNLVQMVARCHLFASSGEGFSNFQLLQSLLWDFIKLTDQSVNSNKKPFLNCYWSFFWKLKPYLNHQGAKYCGTKR
jgi:hypothetical protein